MSIVEGTPEQLLAKTIDILFNRWFSLRLAIENSFGGPESQEKAILMYLDLLDFVGNSSSFSKCCNLDIECFLEDFFLEELNSLCEDNSISEVSKIIFNLSQEFHTNTTFPQMNLFYQQGKDFLQKYIKFYQSIDSTHSDTCSNVPSSVSTNQSKQLETNGNEVNLLNHMESLEIDSNSPQSQNTLTLNPQSNSSNSLVDSVNLRNKSRNLKKTIDKDGWTIIPE